MPRRTAAHERKAQQDRRIAGMRDEIRLMGGNALPRFDILVQQFRLQCHNRLSAAEKAYAAIVEGPAETDSLDLPEPVDGRIPPPTDVVGRLPKRVVEHLQRKKRAGAREVVEWVFENIGDPRGADPMTAPSLGAWTLYGMAVSSSERMHWFIETFYKPLLPSRAQMELESQFNDDGRNLSDFAKSLADAAEESVFEHVPTHLQSEPQVPGQGAANGRGQQGGAAQAVDDVQA